MHTAKEVTGRVDRQSIGQEEKLDDFVLHERSLFQNEIGNMTRMYHNYRNFSETIT
jgi:hypothetical protein